MPRCLCALLALTSAALFCGEGDAQPRWYKGNTHAHTILCGHADSTPEVVTAWYHDHGYNFLVLSEHNKFIDPATVTMPENKRADFTLIPGEEITSNIHVTAMNILRLVKEQPKDATRKTEILQKQVDDTLETQGIPILNHPNFVWELTGEQILPVKRLHLFELFNGHPTVHNFGDATHPSLEQLWDFLLSKGMVIYGTGSDDVHNLKQFAPGKSNAGRGWAMVRAAALTGEALTDAMLKGDFYCSSGVMLKTLNATPTRYTIEVDEAATQKEFESPVLYPRAVADAKPGYLIEFIGKDGAVLHSVPGTNASFDIPAGAPYVRCKVSFTRKATTGFEQGYAWTQPVFGDDRLAKVQPWATKKK